MPLRALLACPLCALLAACSVDGGPPDGCVRNGVLLDVDSSAITTADATPQAPDGFAPAPHPALPQVPPNGRAVLANLTLVTVVAQNDPDADALVAFGGALVQSHWWHAVADEYGLRTTGQSLRLDGPPISGAVTASAMAQYIRDTVHAMPVALPGADVLFLLYLPPGAVYISSEGTNTDCRYSRGFHTRSGVDGLTWAVVQRCTPAPGQSSVELATQVASHEVIEAASDPDTHNGFLLPTARAMPWTLSAWGAIEAGGAELGDLCHDARVLEDGFVFQRSWSNAAAMAGGDPCVPPIPVPYFSVSTEQAWYPVAAGATIEIAATGFATAPTDDWVVRAPILRQSVPDGFTAQVAGGTSVAVADRTCVATNNGGAVTVRVTASSRVSSGAYAVIGLRSYARRPVGDLEHTWPVGVYVP